MEIVHTYFILFLSYFIFSTFHQLKDTTVYFLRICLLNAQILFGRNLNSCSLRGVVGVLKVVFSNFLDDAGLTQFQN